MPLDQAGWIKQNTQENTHIGMLKKFREILAIVLAVAAINTAAAQQLIYPKRIVNADSVYVHFIV